MRGQAAVVGATRVAPNGYHYTRTQDGWCLTHHLVAEQSLGRPVDSASERVIFVDGDRTNLAAANVRVVPKGNGGSTRSRIARLKARIADLQAEVDLLESES